MDSENNTNDLQSDLIGKKVFFLYPAASVVNQVVFELVQNEYEAYTAKDHSRIAQLLKKYPDSIVFINTDEKISGTEWEKWINTVLSSTPKIKIGIFTSNNNEEFREKFTKNNRITCGFYTNKVDMSKITESILEMLNEQNVKGRRKYLRARTDSEPDAVINIPHNGEFLNGVIKDISVVGVSCVFKHDPGLSKNSILKNVQIKLQSMILKVESVIFGSREEGGEKIYVLVFTQRTDPTARVKIRKYIQKNLQSKMDSEIS